jgi:hypothetical protein
VAAATPRRCFTYPSTKAALLIRDAVSVLFGFFADKEADEGAPSALVFSGPTKEDCNVDSRICISDSSTPAGDEDAFTDEDEEEDEFKVELRGHVKRCIAANRNRSSKTRPSALSAQSCNTPLLSRGSPCNKAVSRSVYAFIVLDSKAVLNRAIKMLA